MDPILVFISTMCVCMLVPNIVVGFGLQELTVGPGGSGTAASGSGAQAGNNAATATGTATGKDAATATSAAAGSGGDGPTGVGSQLGPRDNGVDRGSGLLGNDGENGDNGDDGTTRDEPFMHGGNNGLGAVVAEATTGIINPEALENVGIGRTTTSGLVSTCLQRIPIYGVLGFSGL